MALINCPECGKKVSDTASKCIHCGAPLKFDECAAAEVTIRAAESKKTESVETEKKYFEDLPKAEMNEIYDEYMKVNVDCKKHNTLVKALNIVNYICVGVTIVAFVTWMILFCLHKFSGVDFPEFIVIIFALLIIAAVICSIASCVFRFVFKSLNKKTEKFNAEFKVWLKETKNIDWSYNTDIATK